MLIHMIRISSKLPCIFVNFHCTIWENEIQARRRCVSSEKSGRDGKSPATCIFFRECDLPLSWTCICSAPLLQCLGTWGGMVPHCQCCRCFCPMASVMADLRWNILVTTPHSVGSGNRA